VGRRGRRGKIENNKERGIKLWGGGEERKKRRRDSALASVCTKLAITACNLYKIQ
jgi:hypothetical protein